MSHPTDPQPYPPQPGPAPAQPHAGQAPGAPYAGGAPTPAHPAGGPHGVVSDAPPGGGVIAFTVQGSVLTNSMVPPTLTINGHPVAVPSSGTQRIPCPAGTHHLRIHSQWLRTYGQAELTCQVSPGQQVDVFYAAPVHQFSDGALGFEPQKKKGVGVLIGILVAVVVVVVLLSVLLSMLG